MKSRIMLLDPSMANPGGENSRNLGDLIIFQAVLKELASIFGGESISRASTHVAFDAEGYRQANQCRFRFVGGTNLLSSKKTKYTWYREEHRWNWLFPKLNRVVLLGVGWGVGYPDWNDWRPKVFYHRSLDRRHLHSVRDSFSEKMLRGIGVRNVINTSCPTLWGLDGFVSNPGHAAENCLFTVTDYRRSVERDDALLQALPRHFEGVLYFFPQGAKDIEYLQSLPSFERLQDRIEILPRDVAQLDAFLAAHKEDLLYVGTRLHGGVFAMQHQIPALIISVDHRSQEIQNDTGLPVISGDIDSHIENWLTGALSFDPIRLPSENINRWRTHWRGVAAKGRR